MEDSRRRSTAGETLALDPPGVPLSGFHHGIDVAYSDDCRTFPQSCAFTLPPRRRTRNSSANCDLRRYLVLLSSEVRTRSCYLRLNRSIGPTCPQVIHGSGMKFENREKIEQVPMC